jgi:hypothetical protein
VGRVEIRRTALQDHVGAACAFLQHGVDNGLLNDIGDAAILLFGRLYLQNGVGCLRGALGSFCNVHGLAPFGVEFLDIV